MATLREALAAITRHGDEYRSATPEGWTQGRTLYGGMTVAMSAQVAALFAEGLPPLRSLQFTFVAPATGDLVFRPRLLRRGRSAALVAVEGFGDGQLAALGVFSYGAPRESAVRHSAPYGRDLPAPEDCEAFLPARPGAPGFFQNFETRFVAGARPFSSEQAPPEFDVWIRHRDDEGVDPTVALLALADGLPPAAMTRFPAPAPLSTMTWAVDLMSAAPGRGWFLSRSAAEASADGYSQQAMDIFDRTGARVAAGRQTVAIFV
jgi:acyl-CoA thioesterase